jgi:HEAT repeat protein
MADPNEPSATEGLSIDELTSVYFSLEDSAERDAFLKLLQPLKGPQIDALLHAMMEKDVDPYIRGSAAELLLERGAPAAATYFDRQLADPEDELAFGQAVAVRVRIDGPAAYDRLFTIWQDAERPLDHRREALLGMEQADRPRCLNDLIAWCSSLTDIDGLPQDLLESAMLCFGRAGHQAALPVLRGLQQRVKQSHLPPDESHELAEFIDEGLRLLNPS